MRHGLFIVFAPCPHLGSKVSRSTLKKILFAIGLKGDCPGIIVLASQHVAIRCARLREFAIACIGKFVHQDCSYSNHDVFAVLLEHCQVVNPLCGWVEHLPFAHGGFEQTP